MTIGLVTIMVSDRLNLSAWQGSLPVSDSADRSIKGGPLYVAQQVLCVLERGESAIHLWTRKCISDTKRFDLDLEQALDLVGAAVKNGKFKGSQWCVDKPGGSWVACDSYQVCLRQWIEAARKNMDFEYYIKFAIGRTGKVLLIVSCHPPEEKG